MVLGHGVRFMWFADIKTLIIRVPAVPHEKAHLGFERALTRRALPMGLGNIEFNSIESTLYKGNWSAGKGILHGYDVKRDSSHTLSLRRFYQSLFPGSGQMPDGG